MGMGTSKKKTGDSSATPSALPPASDPAQQDAPPADQSLDQQGQDAADAAGIGSSHADSSDADSPGSEMVQLVQMGDGQQLHPDPEMAALMAREIELRARLEELGNPAERRLELDRLIGEERALFKAQEQEHRQRLSALTQAKRDEFWPAQRALEEIDRANRELVEINTQREARIATLAQEQLAAASAAPALVGEPS